MSSAPLTPADVDRRSAQTALDLARELRRLCDRVLELQSVVGRNQAPLPDSSDYPSPGFGLMPASDGLVDAENALNATSQALLSRARLYAIQAQRMSDPESPR